MRLMSHQCMVVVWAVKAGVVILVVKDHWEHHLDSNNHKISSPARSRLPLFNKIFHRYSSNMALNMTRIHGKIRRHTEQDEISLHTVRGRSNSHTLNNSKIIIMLEAGETVITDFLMTLTISYMRVVHQIHLPTKAVPTRRILSLMNLGQYMLLIIKIEPNLTKIARSLRKVPPNLTKIVRNLHKVAPNLTKIAPNPTKILRLYQTEIHFNNVLPTT